MAAGLGVKPITHAHRVTCLQALTGGFLVGALLSIAALNCSLNSSFNSSLNIGAPEH
jgi:hypothetical protein